MTERAKDFVRAEYEKLLKIAREGYARDGRGFLLIRQTDMPGGAHFDVKYGPLSDPACPKLNPVIEETVQTYDPEQRIICAVFRTASGEVEWHTLGHGGPEPWTFTPRPPQ